MYDIKLKNVRKGYVICLVLFFIGLLFLAIFVGISISKSKKKSLMDSSIMSENVEITSNYNSDNEIMYRKNYIYVVNGKEYVCQSSSSSSSYPNLNNGTVYYESKRPENCMVESTSTEKLGMIIFIVCSVFCSGLGALNMIKTIKRVNKIKELNKVGKLVKNLPYRLEQTGIEVNENKILKPVVDYVLSDGTTITLQGDPRFDKKTSDEDGMVDLVIDESNPDNYFIDFEINRLSGNLESDFYKEQK